MALTVNNKDVLFKAAGSLPSGSHGGGWEGLGEDGGEAVPDFSVRRMLASTRKSRCLR